MNFRVKGLTSFLIIIFIFVTFFFTLITCAIKFNYSDIEELIKTIDVQEYLSNNEIIKEFFEKSKISMDSLKFIDNDRFYEELIKKVKDNEYIIHGTVYEIMNNSIKIYENKKELDITSNLNDEFKELTYLIEDDINDSTLFNIGNYICNFNSYIVLFVILIVIAGLFVYFFYFEKENGFLIVGLSLMFVSIIIYVLLSKIIINNSIFVYVNNSIYSYIKSLFLPLYSIFFIIGCLLSLIWGIIIFVRIIKKIIGNLY